MKRRSSSSATAQALSRGKGLLKSCRIAAGGHRQHAGTLFCAPPLCPALLSLPSAPCRLFFLDTGSLCPRPVALGSCPSPRAFIAAQCAPPLCPALLSLPSAPCRLFFLDTGSLCPRPVALGSCPSPRAFIAAQSGLRSLKKDLQLHQGASWPRANAPPARLVWVKCCTSGTHLVRE